MMRIILLAALSFILTFLFANPLTAQPSTENRPPNIVLIVADDHGREALGCYGNKAVKTPAIDGLASEGTRFSNAFCTSASCSPSRSVLLTGMQNHANGMYGLEHQQHHFKSFDAVKSLPVLLQKAGYRTARVGKFHVAPEQVYHFERVLQEGAVNNPASIGRSPVVMADICKPYINDKSGKPFFLYYAPDDPHRSNSIQPDGKVIFDGMKANAFANKAEGYPQVTKTVFNPAEVIVPAYLPDNKATREELAEYYQAISRLDQGVGRLLEHLKASGQYDNTLVIYLSDNGAPFPGSKTTLYDAGMQLPFIIKLPGAQKKGFVQDAMISWVDITPTLLDFAGALPGNAQLQGRSFRKIIEQDNVTGWDEVYGSHSLHEITMYYPMRVLRERRLKLIYNIAHELQFPMALDLYHSYTWQNMLKTKGTNLGRRSTEAYLHRPRFELYDIQTDPEELHNLAGDPAYDQELKRMTDKLKRFQKDTHDMWISKWVFE
jgi:N-sulfoglucosamine sulfohydrolase